ncbi:MAG: hydrogenase maturation nickel metallochaperone HypA [Spirochaetia bacterium]|jgi:hydrogenase nickel incorporation protein HypA/HybF
MHEYSICQNMVRIALDELKKLNRADARLLTMRIKIGDLHAVIDENILMAYDVLTRETPLAGSRLELVHVPVEARCKDCGEMIRVRDNFFLCPRCESARVEITAGRELFIENLEVSYDEQQTD